MDIQDLLRELHEKNDTKIVLVVADGLGGLPVEPNGPTELEAARTPNLDELARGGVCGLLTPVLPGITCGSGPGHLALFGYDPLRYVVGRGVLSALGIDFELQSNDVAARGNFCIVDDDFTVKDRRAGRPSDEQAGRLIEKLRQIELPGVKLFVEPVKEHRFCLVLRGNGLGGDVSDTDPHAVGVKPHQPKAHDANSKRTADRVRQFLDGAHEALKHEATANMVLLRGFAQRPEWPTMGELYGLSCCALARYPMYRGLSRLLGMDAPDPGSSLTTQIDGALQLRNQYDFFFIHHKPTDSAGEDGDFHRKVEHIEALDRELARIVALEPDVLIVTGDHSTPSVLRSHSWHPVPVVIAARTCRPDEVSSFGEAACSRGGLGQFEAKYLMALALAHAGRTGKFGA